MEKYKSLPCLARAWMCNYTAAMCIVANLFQAREDKVLLFQASSSLAVGKVVLDLKNLHRFC
jgi:hypothetical protein